MAAVVAGGESLQQEDAVVSEDIADLLVDLTAVLLVAVTTNLFADIDVLCLIFCQSRAGLENISEEKYKKGRQELSCNMSIVHLNPVIISYLLNTTAGTLFR